MATPATVSRSVPTRESELSSRFSGVILVVALVGVMWAVEVVDLFAGDLDGAGIEPREAEGLLGIAFAPFLHAGFGHLIGNTIPFLVLGAVTALSGLARTAAVLGVVALVGGFGTWLLGDTGSIHVGASGLVFGLAAYLVVRAWYSRSLMHVAAALAVLAVYGTTLLIGFVPTPGVSWQGHLFGAVGGVVAARLIHRRAPAARPRPQPA